MAAAVDRQTPTQDELENLFVNNGTLDQIEGFLGRFNPIRVMKMERMEIRHSAILGWLLDPNETHNLSDRFLKAFLGEALRGFSSLGYPSALDIALLDLRDAEIRREWQNIDIFILSAANNLTFIVENKYDSRQRKGQLAEYKKKVETTYEFQGVNPVVRGIFLALQQEEPEDDSYATIGYDAICDILANFIEDGNSLLTTEVEVFLKHYVEILREETGMSEDRAEVEKLARQLYRTHKKAIDFVVEHGAGSDFAIATDIVFGEGTQRFEQVSVDSNAYRFGRSNNFYVSFIPEAWFQALGEDRLTFPGCEKYWDGYPVHTRISIKPLEDGAKARLSMVAEVGSLEDHEFRSGLIKRIQEAAKEAGSKLISFRKDAANEGNKYSRFLNDATLDVKDIQDAEEISEAIRQLLKKFQPEFETVSKVLPEFLKYGEKSE